VISLNGEGERSCALLQRTLEGNTSVSGDEKIRALTVLAEALERLGRVAEAETDFKRALALRPRDPYLLGAYLTLHASTSSLAGEWHLALRDLDDAIGLDTDDDGRITWAELLSRKQAVCAYALSRLRIQGDGQTRPFFVISALFAVTSAAAAEWRLKTVRVAQGGQRVQEISGTRRLEARAPAGAGMNE
jgi:tetratricopeptide (TPR) repeat protein